MASPTAIVTYFWPMAAKAERRGIRILDAPISGDLFATSAREIPTRAVLTSLR